MSGRAGAEQRLAWLLCAPAVSAMLLVTAYPIGYSLWLSLFRYDLRFPGERRFIGLDNYLSVLSAPAWWEALGNTLLVITSYSIHYTKLYEITGNNDRQEVFLITCHSAPGRAGLRTGELSVSRETAGIPEEARHEHQGKMECALS